ncbi:FRG domain-containing protein [Primorskyibacter sedentarius]|uniref:FRG domain-containing protein n=1 Tax=Primorskyibacter sedentarius TaxID=745311 RepID=A0A4R3JM70_9RHOB|nr:FRG domain-containing protein [Primorskyibacter sedentarius]TCS67478.1 FRG domain-containing protein [Primorskyibacter sedentarius]
MAKIPVVASVGEYLDFVLDDIVSGKITAYRGHSNYSYKLIPKIYRFETAKKNEERILSELLTESPSDFKDDKSVFEQLVRAQHYGLPTRLLDVSLNPLVALFFAVRDYKSVEKDNDGEVIILEISEQRSKLFDSDAISCVSNLARLTYDEKNTLYQHLMSKKGKGGVSSIKVETFNDMPEVERLVQFVRVEKPYFQNKIRALDLGRFFFVRPKRTNRRILAQSGAFVMSGLLKQIGEETSTAFNFSRIRIDRNEKHSILSDLDKLHINDRTMFPEIENTSRYIGEKYTD